MQKGRELEKGTKRLLEMALRLEQEMPGKCQAVCASGLPLHEYLERMRQSHIVLDQLYSYSPGTNAFQAMALGRVAATGAQPEYYDYIGQGEAHPLISLSPLIPEPELKEQFRSLILAPEKMQNMAAEGRKIVERDNDVRIVAAKFQQHWQKILSNGQA